MIVKLFVKLYILSTVSKATIKTKDILIDKQLEITIANDINEHYKKNITRTGTSNDRIK